MRALFVFVVVQVGDVKFYKWDIGYLLCGLQ